MSTPVPDITALSLRARLAIALRLLAGYCERRGLDHPEIAAFIDHLWRFIGLSDAPGEFERWQADEPLLVQSCDGDEYPAGFEEFLADHGVPDREFRKVLFHTSEVLYDNLFTATDEPGSRRNVGELAALVGPFGVCFPDTQRFAGSRWSQRVGWGEAPTAQELAAWRWDPDA